MALRTRRSSEFRAFCILVVLATLVAACSHGSTRAHGPPSTPSSYTRSATAARSARLLAIGAIDLQRAGTKGSVNTATQRSVLATAQQYLDNAVLIPLETGRLGKGYGGVFAEAIRAAATGPDLNTLADVSVGRTLTLTATSTPVALSALADQTGTLIYTAATFSVKVSATKASGGITIDRRIELTLQPMGGKWLIVAYRITVKRTAPAPVRKTTPTTRPRRTRTTTTTRTHGTTTKP